MVCVSMVCQHGVCTCGVVFVDVVADSDWIDGSVFTMAAGKPLD